ncbi:hypothetical protein [Synechococcus sp. RS9902]|uniref:acyltransferase n=1 Tax=Synechococcus sp. RS9902 TaxID=221345 RepID=UPI001644CC31
MNITIKSQDANYKPITINSDVWIRSSSIVQSGVVLGKGCIIGASSLVNRKHDEYTRNAGNPAKQIGRRGPSV